MSKLKAAFYWGASCGGCEIAVLDINERILELVEHVDIVFWPVAMDIKYKDVETFPDGYVDVTFFNGSVRNSEQEHMAKLLRAKSKVLVAFGACAYEGSVPGLANLHDSKEILNHVYRELGDGKSGSHVPEAGIEGEGGNPPHTGLLRHRQDVGPDRGGRLLPARVPAAGGPDQ